ncbi:unnamed protein product [Clonostachys rosea f. rosea IK726]|uniref:Uncharacterized protein n=1 Tax=Clonostachys rosea f. rosea IK726 TaxID=1349383 RepID=A0ACA9UA73_BIOOC|nr:unnamed protein product [Clonostachys rosea f. rosea IK726]
MEATESGRQLRFYELRDTYDIPDGNKTMTRLDRGRPFPIVSAWRTDFAVEHILYNRTWRDRVFELCQLISYKLPEDAWDEPSLLGSYYASHAEKKLIAYYLTKHVIIPKVVFQGATVDSPREWMQEDSQLQPFVTVASKMPQVPATIRVSRRVCPDCKLFLSHIEHVLGLASTIEQC